MDAGSGFQTAVFLKTIACCPLAWAPSSHGFQTAVFLKTVAWPALAAAAALLFAGVLGRAVRKDLVARSIGLAIAAGVIAVQVGVRGVPSWPPADTLDWLGPLVALAAVAGMGTDLVGERWRVVASLVSAVAITLAGSRLLLVPPGAGESFAWLWAAVALCALWVMTAVLRSSPAPGWFGAWAGASAGSAGLLALAGSALLGQVLGALAALASGLALLGFYRTLIPAGLAGPLVLAYGGVLAYAWAFTEAPRGPLALAFLAPAACGMGLVVRRPALALLASALLALVVTGLAAAWAAGTAPPPYSP